MLAPFPAGLRLLECVYRTRAIPITQYYTGGGIFLILRVSDASLDFQVHNLELPSSVPPRHLAPSTLPRK